GNSLDIHDIELKKRDIRNNLDYDEYVGMTGEWAWPEEAGATQLPPSNNDILGHVIARLRPLDHKKPKSPLKYFSLKACVLGKLCSGKTSCLSKIAQTHGIHVLSTQELINEALTAYNNGETEFEEISESGKGVELIKDIEELPEDEAFTHLSLRAKYGREAHQAIVEGKAIPSDLVVNILLAAIQKIPANSGWILDGFPLDIALAHLLEKALGGSVEEDERVVADSRTNLALDPNPPKPPRPPKPALDLALLLDVSDENAVSRGVTQAYKDTTDSKPDYVFMLLIPQSIEAFHKTWPKLEKWFGTKQNILIRIDANVDEEELFNRVESVLLRARRQLPEDVATPTEDDVALDEEVALHNLSRSLSLDQSSLNPNHLKPTDFTTNINMEKEGSGQLQTSTTKASKTNRNSLTHVEKPLPPGLPEALLLHWENMCQMYVGNIKAVLEELRTEKTLINQYLFNIKEHFRHFLSRPDLKQEMVSQWQKDFNSVADDMRDDDETKAELHLRLDELCGRLRSVSEKRRQDNKQEWTAAVMKAWLTDHTALLLNCHSTLTQVELDRFRDTFCILQKYYLSMANKHLPKMPSKLPTIPLLDSSSKKDLETRTSDSMWQKKLLDDYNTAVTCINSQLPKSSQQVEVETKKTKETIKKARVDKGSKKGPSANKKKGSSSPPRSSTPEPVQIKIIDKLMTQCNAALSHEQKAAEVRLSLVKGHGLHLVDLIQSEAKHTFSSMDELLEEHFENEMKRTEELAEVVRHHIESEAKLLYRLVLDGTHFSLNGDYHMVALPLSRPPSEAPSQSTLLFTQLESLCLQFRSVAPNGLLSYVEFSNLLKNIMILSKNRIALSGTWLRTTQMQLTEIELAWIEDLFKDKYECVDWRRFMLSCAQLWPSPSITQLLDALQRLKAADIENKGYVGEEEFLQAQLWFPEGTVLDPSEPQPHNHFYNLLKFFFQLFADHSLSPPRLNYTSMLLYLAADLNPKQGFLRALTVVLGHRLHQSSLTQLVQLMPSLDEPSEFNSPE
ncbi:hypothetical protein NL108_003902, partial [Boleophthalmus pectinirostris]